MRKELVNLLLQQEEEERSWVQCFYMLFRSCVSLESGGGILVYNVSSPTACKQQKDKESGWRHGSRKLMLVYAICMHALTVKWIVIPDSSLILLSSLTNLSSNREFKSKHHEEDDDTDSMGGDERNSHRFSSFFFLHSMHLSLLFFCVTYFQFWFPFFLLLVVHTTSFPWLLLKHTRVCFVWEMRMKEEYITSGSQNLCSPSKWWWRNKRKGEEDGEKSREWLCMRLHFGFWEGNSIRWAANRSACLE